MHMLFDIRLGALGVAVSLLAAPAAFAHATLETQEAPVNATYKGVVRVPHGCHGAPTLKVRVQIPEGVIAIKPMPKPGWQLETVRSPYTKTYDYFGASMAEGVKEIVWTGKLLDEHYDEFVFRSWLTDSLKPDTTLYFPIVQECEGGQAERWIEIPADGKTRADYKHPAPGVKLAPPKTH
jgi:uncharacterized protein YcnI